MSIRPMLLVAVVALSIFALAIPPSENDAQPLPQQNMGKPAECRWALGEVSLDGTLTDVVWTHAEPIELHVPWQNRKARTNTVARFLWDREYLYFCADLEDNDIYADVVLPNGRVWDNDSLALYFKPNPKKLGYHEFQVSAANTQLEIAHPSRGGGGYHRFAPVTKVQFESVVKHRGSLNDWTDKDRGWSVEGRIPWDAFAATSGPPKVGDRWRFTLGRHDFSVTLDTPEVSSSAPLSLPDFHRYEEYQELVFVSRK